MSDTNLLLPFEDTLPSTEVRKLVDRARIFAGKGKSEATKDAYKSDWKHFSEWCDEHRFPSLPSRPEVIGLYITFMADSGFAASTIKRRLVAISQAHKLSSYDSPTSKEQVREIWKGIRRELGTKPTKS